MSLVVIFTTSLLLLATLGAIIAARLWSDRHFKKLLVWIPICLLAAVSTFKTIDGVMGWPSGQLPPSFELLDYRTDGKIIFVWGIEKGDTNPRTWKTPYDKELHGALEKGKQEVSRGKKVQIKREEGARESGQSQGDTSGRWAAHELFFQQPYPAKSP